MSGDLKKIIDEKNFSQKEIAITIGVSQPTVSDWVRGIKTPAGKNLIKLAQLLNCTTDYILGNEAHDLVSQKPKGIRIPVLGRIPAGTPLEAIEDILDYEEVPENWLSGGKEYFALQIKGNSMHPKYVEKDIVLFEKTDDCESGAECAVIVNGDDATFKKVIKQDEGIVLQPLNTLEHEPKYYSSSDIRKLPIRIVGVAKEIRRQV